jgi:hypothetical protein
MTTGAFQLPLPISPRRRRSALTLIELTMSLAIVTFIVAAKAMSNDSSNLGADATTARSAASVVIDDLKMATAITEQTATAVTMTVPDRDGDGNPETIRYSWSGTAGDSLMRSYNGGTAGAIATNVRALNFTYLTKTVGKPPPVTSAEASWKTHTGGTVTNSVLDASSWAAEYFKPTLTSTANTSTTAWTVSRVQVLLQRNLVALGTITVGIYYADSAKKPTGGALQTTTTAMVNILSSGTQWTEFAYASPANLDPSKAICIVISYATVLGSGGYVAYDSASSDTSISWTTSADGGSTWAAPVTTKSMQFKLWGTSTTQDTQVLTFQPLPPSSP